MSKCITRDDPDEELTFSYSAYTLRAHESSLAAVDGAAAVSRARRR